MILQNMIANFFRSFICINSNFFFNQLYNFQYRNLCYRKTAKTILELWRRPQQDDYYCVAPMPLNQFAENTMCFHEITQ